MRAVVAREPGPPDVLAVADVPVPEPGPGEVTVDVAYAGVGYVDVLFRSGQFPLPDPSVPGIEVSGRVRAVGPDVTGLQPGTPVAALLNDFGRAPGLGGYAEVAAARADLTVALPDGLDPAVAAAAAVNGATAWFALRDLARLAPDEDVVVLGVTGGLGGLVARLARASGAGRVLGVVSREERRAAAEAAGASEVVVAATGADALASALADRTGGRGVDVAVDPVGGAQRAGAFAALAPLGRLVVVGDASGEDVALSGDEAWHGTRTVSGLSMGGITHLVPDRVRAALDGVLQQAAADATLVPAPDVRPLADAADVHRELEERRAASKTVLAL